MTSQWDYLVNIDSLAAIGKDEKLLPDKSKKAEVDCGSEVDSKWGTNIVCSGIVLTSSSGFGIKGIYWEGNGFPTPIFLPGKSHGQRSLVGCSPWGCKESDMTERLHFYFSLLCIGEGNGSPLQCSCLENPRDGVTQSRTRLKWLSIGSSSIDIKLDKLGRKFTVHSQNIYWSLKLTSKSLF